ncbi:MAG: acyl-CoA dehydratase activase [Planctomycetota bacterium]
MQYFCGIDIGASAAKLVVVDENRRMVAKALRKSGVDYAETAARCREEALSAAGLVEGQLQATVATGYGRDNVPWADGRMTEIACHGRGAHAHFPQEITVVDIGAQDSKMIHLGRSGRRHNFQMNRKCAAGTGAFLEEIAYRLDLPLSEINGLAEKAVHEVTLGSFCTVFASTEILEKIRAGVKVEEIVKGAFRSVVKRILEMGTLHGAMVLTGGVVAHNPVLAALLGESFGTEPKIPPEPQHVGAFGAALFAMEEEKKGNPQCS